MGVNVEVMVALGFISPLYLLIIDIGGVEAGANSLISDMSVLKDLKMQIMQFSFNYFNGHRLNYSFNCGSILFKGCYHIT